MQPLRCVGGFGLPIKQGKFTIREIKAVVKNPNADSRLLLVDNSANQSYPNSMLEYPAKSRESTYNNAPVVDMRGVGDVDSILRESLPSGLKVNNGISIGDLDNIEAGSMYVYVD